MGFLTSDGRVALGERSVRFDGCNELSRERKHVRIATIGIRSLRSSPISGAGTAGTGGQMRHHLPMDRDIAVFELITH